LLSFRFRFLSLDRVVNFPAMDGNGCRGSDAQPHSLTANLNDGDFVIADHDRLSILPTKNKHQIASFQSGFRDSKAGATK
jgi:hypothetical protein